MAGSETLEAGEKLKQSCKEIPIYYIMITTQEVNKIMM